MILNNEQLSQLGMLKDEIYEGNIETPFTVDDAVDALGIPPEEATAIVTGAVTDGILEVENDNYSFNPDAQSIDYIIQKNKLLEDIETNPPEVGDFSYLNLVNSLGYSNAKSFNAGHELFDSLVISITNGENDYSLLIPELSKLGAFLEYFDNKTREEEELNN